MWNKAYKSLSFGHFLVGLIEYELYLGLFFLLSHFSNLVGQKRIIAMCFFFMINALITTPR
jgi:hypothetical protein